MPLDPEPVAGGNVEIVGEQPSEHGPSPVVVVHGKDDLPLPGSAKRYKSHFATCPNSRLHRRRAPR